MNVGAIFRAMRGGREEQAPAPLRPNNADADEPPAGFGPAAGLVYRAIRKRKKPGLAPATEAMADAFKD